MILHNDITHTRQHFVGGLIAGVGSALSGILGHNSQSSANRAQLKATRETNEMNYKIHKEDQQHAIDMWNMENAYNSPAAQRQRLEEAGYNPYSLFEGGGSTAGNVGLPSSPQMQTPPAEAFQSPMLTGLQQALQTYQVTKSLAQADDKLNIEDRLAQVTEMLGKLDAFDKENRNKYSDMFYKYQVETMKQNFEQDKELFPVQKEQAIIANSLANAELAGKLMDNKAREIELQWLPKEKQVEYETKCAIWFQMEQEGLKTQQEVENLIAEEILTYAKVNESKANTSKIQAEERFIEERIETENLSQDRAFMENEDYSRMRITPQEASDVARARYQAMKDSYEMQSSASKLSKNKFDNKLEHRESSPGWNYWKDNWLPDNPDYVDTAVDVGNFIISRGKRK